MNTEDLIVDDCGDGEVVENLSEGSPDIERAVLFDALVIEAVDLGDQPGLVVASEKSYSVSVAHFEG